MVAIGGRIKLWNNASNRTVARRNILVHPPEPPFYVVFQDPTTSIYIGRTKIFHVPFYWNPSILTNPHIAVVGITGSGKSFFIKTFLTRASFVWNTNALIVDWAGEYKSWVRQTGGKIISLGKGSYINLLDLGGMTPYVRVKQVMRTLALLTDIERYPEQKRLTQVAIEEAYKRNKFKMDAREQRDELGRPLSPPTLKDVVHILEEKKEMGNYEFPAELDNAIFRLKEFTKEGQDFFAQPSTVTLDEIVNAGLVDLDLSGLPDETSRALGALAILQFLKEKMRAMGWAKEKGLRLIIVLDEAWKISKDDNSDVVMIVREGRKYNFGLIVASQNPTDISEVIFSNVGTTFILRIKFAKYMNYLQATLNFSNYIREQIMKFGVGEAAVNLAFTTSSDYSSTFLLEKIDGEEPLYDYFLELKDVVKKKKGELMPTTVPIGKADLRKKLVDFGLSMAKIVELESLFDKHDHHLNVVSFVMLLERWGIDRLQISNLLKDLGIDDSTVINIFTVVDMKKAGVHGREVSQLTLKDDEDLKSDKKQK